MRVILSFLLAILIGAMSSSLPSFAQVTTTAAANPSSAASAITGTLGADHGGTGVANNAASTLTRSGNHALTITTTGTTDVTLPTTGTLADITTPTACTAALTFATPGNLTVVYSNQQCSYTRIAGRYRVSIALTTSTFTHTTASGNLRITGLPAPSAATPSGLVYTGACSVGGITKANYTNFVASLAAGGVSFFGITASGSGVAASSVAFGDMPTGGTVAINCSLEYDS